MTENELELIRILHENDNPDDALAVAVEVITSYLAQLESSEGQAVAGP